MSHGGGGSDGFSSNILSLLVLGAKTAAINASACATAPLGPVIGLVDDGSIGMEQVSSCSSAFQDVHVPSQYLSQNAKWKGTGFLLFSSFFEMFMFQASISQNVNIVALRPYLSHLCPA